MTLTADNLPFNFLESLFVASDSPLTVSLSREDLASHSIVASSAYFSDPSNWKYMIMYFKTSQGRRKLVAQRSREDFSKIFRVTATSGTVFELFKIIIKGKNLSILALPRASIPNAAAVADITIS